MKDPGPYSHGRMKQPRKGAEKRESNRVKVRVPVELQIEGSKGPIRTETADLSLTGFYVEMMFTLNVETPLDIKLQIGDTTVLAVGKVVTCDPTVGNGISFTKMLAEDRLALANFLQAAKDS